MRRHAKAANTPPMPQMPANPESDAALVAKLQRGDDSAFEAIVRAHGGRLLAVARRFLGNDADAQDAVQDAFIRAFKAIHTFEARAQLHTWLHRILVNTALMKLRERRRRPTESIEELLPVYSADGHQTVAARDWSDAVLERKETAGIVREAIARLPDQYREVLLLRDIEEKDTAEAAEILGTTSNVIKVRLHRARQALRTLLDREFQLHAGPAPAHADKRPKPRHLKPEGPEA
ncbi:MAG TPA: sigma-70 family RNA polymerase sigma factor [Vicinamibacterales bacterium]|jgi:RNA polymerase sigma-70 factor, ECF subfamily|nr:sigma-70 family RNA polymerase sigma factor [Vicinamibacterales bacterium]